MATKTTKTWNKGVTKDTLRWLTVFAAREMAETRRNPIAAEFWAEAKDEDGWCSRVEYVPLNVALSVMDASPYESDAQMGCIATAWGDALLGIIPSKTRRAS